MHIRFGTFSGIAAASLIARTATVTAAMALAACGSTIVSRTGPLDARFAWPCDRLILEWAVEPDRLQQMVSAPLKVRRIQGAGRLQLHVMHCQAARPAWRDSRALSYAYVLVAVLGDTAPIGITLIPPDGWFAMPHAAAGGAARTLLEGLGYLVIEAAQHFTITQADGASEVAIELSFGEGRISIGAQPDRDPSDYNAYSAYLGNGDGYVSAFFGREVSERYSASATVRFAGQTPLSRMGLGSTPVAAVLDRGLVSDRIFWRIPGG